MKLWCVTIQLEATEQYFYVVLFMLFQLVLNFKSVNEALVCDHSIGSY